MYETPLVNHTLYCNENPITITSNPDHAKNSSYARIDNLYLTKREHCSLVVVEKWYFDSIFRVNKYSKNVCFPKGATSGGIGVPLVLNIHVSNQFSRISFTFHRGLVRKKFYVQFPDFVYVIIAEWKKMPYRRTHNLV